MSIYLVCEGPHDGLDVRVLDLVIVQKLGRDTLVEPAGGDRSLGSVANYLEKRYRVRAFAVEDRNFRSLEEAERAWQQPNQKRWIWRRHEIENYLLEPRLVADAFRALKRDLVRGADKLPDDPDVILHELQELAQPMLEDHAGWLAYWQLVFHKRDKAETRLLWPDPSLRPSPGSSYPDRTEWLAYLHSECIRLKQACMQVCEDITFDAPAIAEVYDRILSQVTHPNFLDSRQFLIDLGGHELMSALCTYVNRTGIPHLSCSDLATELLNALDRLYEPGFFDPDDFAQLANRLT